MNNDAVSEMVKAGLSDDVVISKIDAAPGNYDTSTSALVALKKANVSDKVVSALVTKAYEPASAPAACAQTANDPNDPNSPHDPGVYLLTTGPDGAPRMVFVDRVGESAMKVSNLVGAAFSFGAAKMKLKTDIPGAHATVRTTAARPVFYMYFPDIASFGAFAGVDMITSPSQFALSQVDVQKDNREIVIAKMGLGGATIGADKKKTVAFTVDRIRPRIYKIVPSAGLKPGEYAFVAVLMGAIAEIPPTVVVYDFGVDPLAQ